MSITRDPRAEETARDELALKHRQDVPREMVAEAIEYLDAADIAAQHLCAAVLAHLASDDDGALAELALAARLLGDEYIQQRVPMLLDTLIETGNRGCPGCGGAVMLVPGHVEAGESVPEQWVCMNTGCDWRGGI